MLDSVRLRCNHCGKDSIYSVPYIQGQIKAMKKHKYEEVALQLQEKRGPFYDKWKAAMEARGEVLRCKECRRYEIEGYYAPKELPTCKERGINGGRFACKWFKPIEGD